MSGAVSRTDGSLEIGREEDWYDRAGELGLLGTCVDAAFASSCLSPLLLKRTLVIFALPLPFEIELSTSCSRLLISLSAGCCDRDWSSPESLALARVKTS